MNTDTQTGNFGDDPKEFESVMLAINHPWSKDWDRERDVPQGNFDRGDETSDVASLDPTRPNEAHGWLPGLEQQREDNPTSRKIREAYAHGKFVGWQEGKAHADKLAEALRMSTTTLETVLANDRKNIAAKCCIERNKAALAAERDRSKALSDQRLAVENKLAEALRKVRTCSSLPDSVMDLVRQALTAYESEVQP